MERELCLSSLAGSGCLPAGSPGDFPGDSQEPDLCGLSRRVTLPRHESLEGNAASHGSRGGWNRTVVWLRPPGFVSEASPISHGGPRPGNGRQDPRPSGQTQDKGTVQETTTPGPSTRRIVLYPQRTAQPGQALVAGRPSPGHLRYEFAPRSATTRSSRLDGLERHQTPAGRVGNQIGRRVEGDSPTRAQLRDLSSQFRVFERRISSRKRPNPSGVIFGPVPLPPYPLTLNPVIDCVHDMAHLIAPPS